MKPDYYTNARGEAVMTLAVFKSLSFDSVWKAVAPRKR